jgi:hypothetical protein
MKKKETEVRHKMVVVRLNAEEFSTLLKLQQQTTETTLSNYLRKVALQKPVLVKYRNSSADDFLRDMLELRKDLTMLSGAYQEAVKQLHLLQSIPEFRTWIAVYEHSRQAFLSKVEQIHIRITRLYELWLQK